MDVVTVLESQYLAALKALRATTQQCPAKFWTDATTGAPFWRVTYHTLWYTAFYLNQDPEPTEPPWEDHIHEYQFIGPIWWDDNRLPAEGEPYTQQQLMSFHDQMVRIVQTKLPTIDLDGKSTFYWIPTTWLEVMIYSIRHIQHHAGALSQRLRSGANVDVAWVRMGADD